MENNREDFDVVIATSNRHSKVKNLISQILECSILPQRVIVVDSSDEPNKDLFQNQFTTYLTTKYKNQPYQRYVGYLRAKSPIVIFFDDDIIIQSKDIFKYYLKPFEEEEIVGVSVGIVYQNPLTKSLPKNNIAKKIGHNLSRLLFLITGVPSLDAGKLWLAGLTGAQPFDSGHVEFFQGTNMCFRRKFLFEVFDEKLFELYSNRLGKGEDKVLSMKIATHGRLHFHAGKLLFHPPEETLYFNGIEEFQKRVACSRLYLSLIFCKARDIHFVVGLLHYLYFMFWRILISFFLLLLTPTKFRFHFLKGQGKGILCAIRGIVFRFKNGSDINWKREANKDAGII